MIYLMDKVPVIIQMAMSIPVNSEMDCTVEVVCMLMPQAIVTKELF